ncbi:MAG: Gfo/Idh/MocA family protein, partial [Mucilaginibacter sp.]
MTKVKVGVIGCGSIANHRHITEYAANPNVELVAFCDVLLERAEKAASKYGGKAYQNYEDLLANEEVEAVSVCTPNYLHAPISIAALNEKKHVLCEKPMATSE